MKKIYVIVPLVFFVIAFSQCNKAGYFPDSGYDERLSGGLATETTFDESASALSHMIDGLGDRDQTVHSIGDATFSHTFIPPADSLKASIMPFAVLGPIFNNISCVSCHRNDGEGVPTAGFSNSGLLVRLSLPGFDENGGPLGVPGFGGQLQDKAMIGTIPEASVQITYIDTTVTYLDGTIVILRKPSYSFSNPGNYMQLPPNVMYSPRLAPPLVGLGLLEIVPEQTILSFVDATDANGDGITGKANYAFDVVTKKMELGRFGVKANTPTLLTQVAAAFQQDMGITSFVFPQESSFGQSQYTAKLPYAYDTDPELADSILNYTAFYVQTLAVPARRSVSDPDVKRGENLFTQINCAGCHKPTMQTGVDVTKPILSNQRIHPYTDLLVHDMGPGLADGRPDYLANGNEWRTAPLWGRGMLEKANGIPYFLHDGRARSFEEAILWHDGEAKKSKQQFMQLNAADRANVIKFLQSL